MASIEAEDAARKVWIVELGRPPLAVALEPQFRPRGVELVEVDAAPPPHPYNLGGRGSVAGDDDALASLGGGDQLRQTGFGVTNGDLHKNHIVHAVTTVKTTA